MERTYEVNSSKLTLKFGDITKSQAEILVSSDNYLLSMAGGVSKAIRNAAGFAINDDAKKMSDAQAGDVVVTTAGELPAKYILHAITVGDENYLPAEVIVRHATRRAMQLLPLLGCRSIAFPAIGAGVARIPYNTVAAEMGSVIVEALLDTSESFHVELYLMDLFREFDRAELLALFESHAKKRLGLSTNSDNQLRPPAEDSNNFQTQETSRRQQIYLMLRHLDARRNELDKTLLGLLSRPTGESSTLTNIRQQLEDVRLLRKNYEEELSYQSVAIKSALPKSIFVSSTSMDLRPHRLAVRDVIRDLNLKFVGMEEFSPTSLAPADLIRRKVVESRVYLGILGLRYGFVEPSTGLSMTELEYRQAVASDKSICMFVMDNNAPIYANMVEDDPERFAKMYEFRNHVLRSHTCAMFMGPDDLAQKAQATLKESFVE